MLPKEIFGLGLSPTAIALFAAIAYSADNKTGLAFATRKTLAKRLGFTRAATVDRYLKELEAAHILESTVSYKKPNQKRSDGVQHQRGGEYIEQTSNDYRLLQPASANADGGCTQMRTGGVRERGHRTRPRELHPVELVNTRSADADLDHAPTIDTKGKPDAAREIKRPEPIALPEDWQPNSTHRRIAERGGVDLSDAAYAFQTGVAGERRRDWDAAFGRYLRDAADDLEGVTFPGVGYIEAARPLDRDYCDAAQENGLRDAEDEEYEHDLLESIAAENAARYDEQDTAEGEIVDVEIVPTAAASRMDIGNLSGTAIRSDYLEQCFQCRTPTPSPDPVHRGLCRRCFEHFTLTPSKRTVAAVA